MFYAAALDGRADVSLCYIVLLKKFICVYLIIELSRGIMIKELNSINHADQLKIKKGQTGHFHCNKQLTALILKWINY